jgi:hypothetical protein|tara:strand:- start:702 stop:1082 length:381 start_codon:yes stop_codon:yes gene_type:complete
LKIANIMRINNTTNPSAVDKTIKTGYITCKKGEFMSHPNRQSRHVAMGAPGYNNYDTHDNYLNGVIIDPVHYFGGAFRTSDGQWAECHPPNGVNLRGAYGVRWWITGSEKECLEADYQDDLAYWAD